ncbi:MAG: helix-turn-helix domain-containing protein [Pseudonocardia sp.]
MADSDASPASTAEDGARVDPVLAELSQEIRRRRGAAGLSHSQLAERTGYARQYVSLSERPRKCGVPSRHLVAAIDGALDAGGALITLRDRAARAREERRATASQAVTRADDDLADVTTTTRRPTAPTSVDPYPGPDCSSALDATVLTLAQLSGWDMDRRQFLTGATFAAASFAEPALFALTTAPAAAVTRAAGRRMGMEDVQVLRESSSHLRKLDHKYGSSRIREQAIHLLNIGTSTISAGTYTDDVGRALVSAVAHTAWLAGSASADVGLYPLAQRYYVHALNLAVNAGDSLYAANLLSHMSRLTVQMGNSSPDENTRHKHALQAVSLARAGRMVAERRATPVLSALLDAVEARGHALLGRFVEARTAALNAGKHSVIP